mgnify:CR=1 FL=1
MTHAPPGPMPLVLHVDDHEASRYATGRILRKAGYRVTEAASGSEALRHAAEDLPDLVLLDVNLPDISGFEVCRRMKADPRTARVPIVHISASSVETAQRVHGLEGGADSYLTEPVAPEVLLATLRAALRTKQAEDAAHQLARQWQTTFDAMADGVALLDPEGCILRWNRALETLTGSPPEQLRAAPCYRLWSQGGGPDEKAAFQRILECRRREETDISHRGRALRIGVDPVLSGPDGALTGAVYVVSDVTERNQLEAQFREAQKFESIAQLAGGVAHDFNNLLTSILGNVSLVLSDLERHHPVREKLDEVVRASERAAELTRQLLAYSGGGRFIMRRLDISRTLGEMEGLLRSSIPKKVRLLMDLRPELPEIEADPAQIQQTMFNLVANAAEAIGDAAGTVRVTTRLERAEDGERVCLEVRDTGCGMDEHVRTHACDPFFTTKFTGRGLGLSAVSGIMRGHRGSMEVASAPGEGATFRLLFPPAAPVAAPAPRRAAVPGGAQVLVVDDEEMVRRMAKATLEIRGYKVLTAIHGQQAVDIVREIGREIGVVLLDMMMPVMAGEEAMEHIMRLYPAMRVIATSGYDEQEAARRFGSHIAGFLQKPYTSRQLAEKIRAAMEAGPAAGESVTD